MVVMESYIPFKLIPDREVAKNYAVKYKKSPRLIFLRLGYSDFCYISLYKLPTSCPGLIKWLPV